MPRTKFKQSVNVVVTIEPVCADHSKYTTQAGRAGCSALRKHYAISLTCFEYLSLYCLLVSRCGGLGQGLRYTPSDQTIRFAYIYMTLFISCLEKKN